MGIDEKKFELKQFFCSLLSNFSTFGLACSTAVPDDFSFSLDWSKGFAITKIEDKVPSAARLSLHLTSEQAQSWIDEYKEISWESAKAMAMNKMNLLQAMYVPQASPYPGRISNTITCQSAPEMKFESRPNSWMYFTTLWANSRFAFGSCEREDQAYYGVVVAVYCFDRKRYYELKYFVKNYKTKEDSTQKRLQKFVDAIHCK